MFGELVTPDLASSSGSQTLTLTPSPALGVPDAFYDPLLTVGLAGRGLLLGVLGCNCDSAKFGRPSPSPSSVWLLRLGVLGWDQGNKNKSGELTSLTRARGCTTATAVGESHRLGDSGHAHWPLAAAPWDF